MKIEDFEKKGLEMIEEESNLAVTNNMSMDAFGQRTFLKVLVRHKASITYDQFVIHLENYSDDYVGRIEYSLDGKAWYLVENVKMDEKNSENISYRDQHIDAPTNFRYKEVKIRAVSKEGNYYEYQPDKAAGAGAEVAYKVLDRKDNNNVPDKIFVRYTFSGTEKDKIKVPGTSGGSGENPDSGGSGNTESVKEVLVDGSVIAIDLDTNRDIVEQQPIRPIHIQLFDKDAELLLEIENLPKGLHFNGAEITGTPEMQESDWDPAYYGGLHKEFIIRIRAKKEGVLLVKEEKLCIRRDKNRNGIPDYEESDAKTGKEGK